jgi:hypothetical protein
LARRSRGRKGGGREAGARLLVMEVEGWKSCPVLRRSPPQCFINEDAERILTVPESTRTARLAQLVLHALSLAVI